VVSVDGRSIMHLQSLIPIDGQRHAPEAPSPRGIRARRNARLFPLCWSRSQRLTPSRTVAPLSLPHLSRTDAVQ
jgi:hypothetical protein